MHGLFSTTIAAAVFALAAAAPLAAAHGAPSSSGWRDPMQLPALPETPLVHYERGAAGYARQVAALLPAAARRVEGLQGRPFSRVVPVAVFVSQQGFAAANGLGHPRAAGVTIYGRVVLSPLLFSVQRQRLAGVLTHELSHAHLQGWVSAATYIRLPNWFKEGLAVMVSGGGGAEQVSEAEARDAIRRGERIAMESEGSWQNLTNIAFEHPSSAPGPASRAMLAYREAGLFVAFLQERDAAGFARLMAAVIDGRPFKEALSASYGAGLQQLWSDFERANQGGKAAPAGDKAAPAGDKAAPAGDKAAPAGDKAAVAPTRQPG